MALVVRDELQGQGLGRALTRPLVEHARAAGIRCLRAQVHSANSRALRLLRPLPYRQTREFEGATAIITLHLDSPHA